MSNWDKRASNRSMSTNLLDAEEGLAYTSHNDGAHLIVEGPHGLIDFWPGTGKWVDRKTKQPERRGVFSLLAYVQGKVT